MPICSFCRLDLPLEAFTGRPDRPRKVHSKCKSCYNLNRRLTRAKRTPEEKEQASINNYVRVYGISVELATRLAKDRVGPCKMCGNILPLEVDHCHKTNRVRGLLCHHCNILLGAARDNIDTLTKGIEYLRMYHELL